MITVLSPYPSLEMRSTPKGQFVDGRLSMTEEDVEKLRACGRFDALGLTLSTETSKIEDSPIEESVEEAEVVPVAVKLPGKNASIADWLRFMDAHQIPHDEGATRNEMRGLAETHFSQT